MIIDALKSLYFRDLNQLKKEIELYISDANLWRVEGKITNSGGNLCYHLIGNLKAFVGAELGGSNYIRQRDLEFSAKHIKREKLVEEIEETLQIVMDTLSILSDKDLEKEYPIIVFKEKMTTGYFLIHLATHLNYHLGQINYHRRLLDR
jgi:uncharacterized damage-inducible protein DinB